ncbi:MAG: hypothetical protein GTO62_11040, partial [Planctomycetales bacterium]|nr:hypothetical protein [Planctomycetales bacterium]
MDKTARLSGAIYQQAAWHALFLAVAMVVVLALAIRWQRSLLQPLAELTGLTERISATKDLNLRA